MDWKNIKLKDVAFIDKKSLGNNTLEDFEFRYLDLSAVNNGIAILPKELIKFKDAPSRARRVIDRGDVLMATVRPNLLGHCLINFNSDGVVCSTGFAVIQAKKDLLDNKFIYQYLFSDKLNNELKNMLVGSNYPAINSSEVGNLVLSLPSLLEQKRIVSILETWDAAIEKLARKIEVKKNVKKSLMQKLLTGKVRLSGFSEEWQAVKAGDVCNINRGDMITGDTITHGDIPVIAGGKEFAYYHNKYNYDGKTITVSGSGASAGYINYFNIPIFASDCSVIKNKADKSDIDYIYYSLKSKQGYIYSLQTGGAQPHVYPRDLLKIKLFLPGIKEQAAIADVLIKADQEIKFLAKKLNKLRDQKKYLLNNLIIGKIRTPDEIQ